MATLARTRMCCSQHVCFYPSIHLCRGEISCGHKLSSTFFEPDWQGSCRKVRDEYPYSCLLLLFVTPYSPRSYPHSAYIQSTPSSSSVLYLWRVTKAAAMMWPAWAQLLPGRLLLCIRQETTETWKNILECVQGSKFS